MQIIQLCSFNKRMLPQIMGLFFEQAGSLKVKPFSVDRIINLSDHLCDFCSGSLSFNRFERSKQNGYTSGGKTGYIYEYYTRVKDFGDLQTHRVGFKWNTQETALEFDILRLEVRDLYF